MRVPLSVLLVGLGSACGPSLVELRALAQTQQLQADAPIQGQFSATVNAPVDVVWSVFADVEGWEKWNDDAAAAEIHGPFTAGTEFAYGAPSRHHLVLAWVEPLHGASFYGTLAGYKGITLWSFESTQPGETKLSVRESNDGFLISWFYSENELELHLALWGDRLKHEAERRASLSSAR